MILGISQSRVVLGGLVLFFAVSACAPKGSKNPENSDQKSSVKFFIAPHGTSSIGGTLRSGLRGLGFGGNAPFELRDDYCYAVHITGTPEFQRMAPRAAPACPNEPAGLGRVIGLVSKGGEIRVDMALAKSVRFDLIGFPKTQIPGGVCSGTFTADPKPGFSSAGENEVILKLNGAVLSNTGNRLIAKGVTDIDAGDNVIALVATAAGPEGVDYGCPAPPSDPVAQFNGLPGAYSNASSLAITVAGSNVDQYRYKFGAASTVLCSVSSGYGATLSVLSPITLSGLTDNVYRLCALGGVSASALWQSVTAATSYDWTRDSTGAVVGLTSFTTGATFNAAQSAAAILSGTCDSPGATVQYTFGSISAATLCGASTWGVTTNVTSVADAVSILVTAKLPIDLAGNTSMSGTSVWVNKDTVAPTMSVTSPSSGAYVTSATVPNFMETAKTLPLYPYRVPALQVPQQLARVRFGLQLQT
jgi:hypothetical protein